MSCLPHTIKAIQKVTLLVSVLIILVLVECTDGSKQRKTETRMEHWKTTVSFLTGYKSELMKEAERAESFVTTAEVHQVLRTPEQKEEQVANLRLYQKRIAHQIDSLDVLIKRYEDSLRLASD